MFGNDFLSYCYDKHHGTRVDDTIAASILEYCHDHWERQYAVHLSPQPPQDLSSTCHPRATNLLVDTDMLDKPPLPPQPTKCDLPVGPITFPSSPQLKAAVVIEDQNKTLLQQQTALQVAMANAATRGEEAALHSLLPPLSSRPSLTLRPVYGKRSYSDPFSLAERPPESSENVEGCTKGWFESYWC